MLLYFLNRVENLFIFCIFGVRLGIWYLNLKAIIYYNEQRHQNMIKWFRRGESKFGRENGSLFVQLGSLSHLKLTRTKIELFYFQVSQTQQQKKTILWSQFNTACLSPYFPFSFFFLKFFLVLLSACFK